MGCYGHEDAGDNASTTVGPAALTPNQEDLWDTRSLYSSQLSTDDLLWADWFGGLPSDAVASMGAAVLLFFLPASPPAWWPSGGPVAACLRAVRGKSAPPPRSARYDVGSGQGGLPAEPIVNWEDMKELPWAVVLLMGGGFALSDGIKESGMLESLSGGVVALSHWPHWLLPLASAGVVTVVTEVASNTATASIFLPVLVKLDLPYNLMLIPATLACSLAFMLPNATPPNAIVYSTGIIEVKDMLLPGLMLNIAGVVLVVLLVARVVCFCGPGGGFSGTVVEVVASHY